ncbi:MAG: ABC transporter substrate-binding protein [Treponema sp.]|nr:ABC transporter substrate-binding protein [Treponema sp.]
MKKIGVVLLCLVLPAFVFAGGQKQASGGSSNYLRFAWWGNTVRDERTRKLVDLFEQKNPGVTIETETTGWDDYWVKLNTQTASGSLPDVMQQDYSYITMYNDKNLLENMDPFVQKGVIDLSKWTKDTINSGRLGGKLIALDLGTNCWGMLADPAILKKAGVTIDDTNWTWKDYEQMAIAIFKATGAQTVPFGDFDQIPEHIVRQFSLAMFSKDGKSVSVTNNPAAYAAVKEIFLDMPLRLKAAGALYDPEDAFIPDVAMEEMPLSLNKAWNAYQWSNEFVSMQEAAGRPLDYYLCPSVAGNKAPYGTYFQPSQFISMLSSSKNKDLGAKFVNFFLNDLEANRFLLAERGIPVPTDVRSDLAGRVDPAMKYMFDFITRVTPYTSPIDPPAPSAVDELRDMTRPIILQCYTGQISSDAAMAQIVKTANDILNQ